MVQKPDGALPVLRSFRLFNPPEKSGGYNKLKLNFMIKIPLTQGRFALINDEDALKVLPYKWRVIQNRYVVGRLGGSSKNHEVRLHRLIMDAPTNMDVDHKNHDGFDNQKSNLRICTTSQNLANQRPQKRKLTSKYKGVSWGSQRKKWQAAIKQFGKKIFIGRFDDEKKAAKAYNDMAMKLFGEFAYLNIIS
jgi:hypothetical protein